jgi:hypothetical protein
LTAGKAPPKAARSFAASATTLSTVGGCESSTGRFLVTIISPCDIIVGLEGRFNGNGQGRGNPSDMTSPPLAYEVELAETNDIRACGESLTNC